MGMGLFITSNDSSSFCITPELQPFATSSTNTPDFYGLINILYLKADVNIDGTITHGELKDVFEGFDKNHDGEVTNAEFVELWKLLTSQTDALANAYFHLADLTDDNVIDDNDYPIIYKLFDLNHDGKVTAQEFVSKWEDIIRETPFAVLFERADTNGDENLSKQEFLGFFSSFDRNNDGKVDIQELKDGWSHADFALQSDAVSLFHEVDHNNDGFIQGAADYDRLFSLYDDNDEGNFGYLPDSWKCRINRKSHISKLKTTTTQRLTRALLQSEQV